MYTGVGSKRLVSTNKSDVDNLYVRRVQGHKTQIGSAGSDERPDHDKVKRLK